jgi:hypothetical protein
MQTQKINRRCSKAVNPDSLCPLLSGSEAGWDIRNVRSKGQLESSSFRDAEEHANGTW